MRLSVTELFPEDWKITVEVYSNELDKYGEPIGDGKPIQVPNCIIDYNQTVDPADRSQIPEDHPVLFAPIGSPIKSTSKVRIPETPISNKGLYVVDGEIGKSPLGMNINLRKG